MLIVQFLSLFKNYQLFTQCNLPTSAGATWLIKIIELLVSFTILLICVSNGSKLFLNSSSLVYGYPSHTCLPDCKYPGTAPPNPAITKPGPNSAIC